MIGFCFMALPEPADNVDELVTLAFMASFMKAVLKSKFEVLSVKAKAMLSYFSRA